VAFADVSVFLAGIGVISPNRVIEYIDHFPVGHQRREQEYGSGPRT
jgi:hypothetical protein